MRTNRKNVVKAIELGEKNCGRCEIIKWARMDLFRKWLKIIEWRRNR